MTPADRRNVVKKLHENLVGLLSPHGITVEHGTVNVGHSVCEFTFRVPKSRAEKVPGRDSELIIHLDYPDAQLCHTNPAHFDELPRAWGRILADWVPELFDAAELPTAEAIDWRPGEILPEDFGAA